MQNIISPLRNSRCLAVLFVYKVKAAFAQGFQRIKAFALPMPTYRKVGGSYGKMLEGLNFGLFFLCCDFATFTVYILHDGILRIKFHYRSRVRTTLCLWFTKKWAGKHRPVVAQKRRDGMDAVVS